MGHGFEIIDIHQHIGPYFNFHVPCSNASEMVQEMDRLGIRQGWLSSHAAIEGDALIGNAETAAALSAYPDRFVGYAVFDPHYPEESTTELKRLLAIPGFRCIKLHPSLAGYPLDGPNYDVVWHLAESWGCPVLTHAWTGDPTCGPTQVRRVLERYHDVHLIFGHALYPPTFPEAAELAKSFDNIYLDITTSQHAYGFIEHAVTTVGAERILFGSDSPFISAAGAVGLVLYAEISDEDRSRILGRNAAQLLANWRGPVT